ncbi:MAG: hypothetical protein AT713_03090 [Caldivirga sp. JCHS_4]|jgi:hypothetical protein|nr:MAG: hypothetical protein AT713_03090 [Caldivirga sp. JCHS_4]
MSMDDVVDKVLRLRDALETVESINNRLSELPRIFMVILTVAVATLGVYDILWFMLGTVYASLRFLWIPVILGLILFSLYYTVHRLNKARKVKGLYQDWSDKLKEGALGVLAILEGLDWDYVEYRVNRAKSLYPILLIIDETALAVLFYFIVGFAYALVNYLLFNITNDPWHVFTGPWYVFTLAILVALTVALTLAVTWGKIVNTFKTLWSLDSLLWEVRWLYHEYRKLQT